jgi:hypothetical protein
VEKARTALCFTLSEDVTRAIPPGDGRVCRIAENLAVVFQPLETEERRALSASAAGLTPVFPLPA